MCKYDSYATILHYTMLGHTGYLQLLLMGGHVGSLIQGPIGGWISTSSCEPPRPPTWPTWSLPAWGRVASTSSVRMEGRGIAYDNMTIMIIYMMNIWWIVSRTHTQQQCFIMTWVFEHILPIFVSEELKFKCSFFSEWVCLSVCESHWWPNPKMEGGLTPKKKMISTKNRRVSHLKIKDDITKNTRWPHLKVKDDHTEK